MAKEQTEITRKSISELLDEANKSENTDQSPANTLTTSDLEKLEGMSREGLVGIVRRIGGARWAEIMIMTDEERVNAIVDNLVHTALTSADRKEARESGKEALNRLVGTSVQRQAIMTKNVSEDGFNENSAASIQAIDSFIAEFAEVEENIGTTEALPN